MQRYWSWIYLLHAHVWRQHLLHLLSSTWASQLLCSHLLCLDLFPSLINCTRPPFILSDNDSACRATTSPRPRPIVSTASPPSLPLFPCPQIPRSAITLLSAARTPRVSSEWWEAIPPIPAAWHLACCSTGGLPPLKGLTHQNPQALQLSVPKFAKESKVYLIFWQDSRNSSSTS